MNGQRSVVASIAALLLTVGIAVSSRAADSLAEAVRSRYGAAKFSTTSVLVPEELSEHVGLTVTIDGVPRQLTLQRTSVRGPHFEVLAQGADGRLVPVTPGPVRTYTGAVDGEPGTSVTALLGAGGIRATIRGDGDTRWYVRPAPDGTRARRHEHVVFAASDVLSETAAETCEEPLVAPQGESVSRAQPRSLGGFPVRPVCGVERAELGLDLASDYFIAAGSSVAVALAKAEESVNAMNAVYVRDALLEYQIGRIIVRTNPATDPYAGITDSLPFLYAVVEEWNRNQQDSGHDIASGVSSSFQGAGVAYHAAACTPWRYAASGSSADLTFDLVLRHELGHSWGAWHYSGGALEGPTIMSGNALSRLSGHELSVMLAYRDRLACLDHSGPHAVAVDPYGRIDEALVEQGKSVVLDVLSNDHDANCDALTLADVDTTSTRGGTIVRSVGTGPGGRDEVVYTAPAMPGVDTFVYVVADAVGRSAEGRVVVEVTADPVALYEAEDADQSGDAFDDRSAAYTGRGFRHVLPASPGAPVQWTVGAATATTARLAIRYSNGGSDATGKLEVNGAVAAPTLQLPPSLNPVGGPEWDTWAVSVEIPVALAAGHNSVRLSPVDTQKFDVDHLRVIWDDPAAALYPPRFRTNPVLAAPAMELEPYSFALGDRTEDGNAGDPASFSLAGPSAWIAVAADGRLSGTPTSADVGTTRILVRATDGSGLHATGSISVPVLCDGPDADGDGTSDACDPDTGLLALRRVALSTSRGSLRGRVSGILPATPPFGAGAIEAEITAGGGVAQAAAWSPGECIMKPRSLRCTSVDRTATLRVRWRRDGLTGTFRLSLRTPGAVDELAGPVAATIRNDTRVRLGHADDCRVGRRLTCR